MPINLGACSFIERCDCFKESMSKGRHSVDRWAKCCIAVKPVIKYAGRYGKYSIYANNQDSIYLRAYLQQYRSIMALKNFWGQTLRTALRSQAFLLAEVGFLVENRWDLGKVALQCIVYAFMFTYVWLSGVDDGMNSCHRDNIISIICHGTCTEDRAESGRLGIFCIFVMWTLWITTNK